MTFGEDWMDQEVLHSALTSKKMVESACLEHETSNGEREVDIVSALRESVSFGRFVSELLDWGKWSSFGQNRYQEDVEKHSTPGSVAQKKAYFEAHYKMIAAKKAAALLEQANTAATNDAAESEVYNGVVDNGKSKESIGEDATNEAVDVGLQDTGSNESEISKENISDAISKIEALIGSSDKSIEIVEDVKNQNKDTEMGIIRSSPLEKQPLKESSISNQDIGDINGKNPRVPISKPIILRRSSRLPPSSTSKPPKISPSKTIPPMYFGKENKSTARSKKYKTGQHARNKSIPKSLHMSININQCQDEDALLMTNALHFDDNVQDSLKVSQNCLYHPKTPIEASSDGLPNLASTTPRSKKQRTKVPSQQMIFGGRKADGQSHTSSPDCSKNPWTRGIREQPECVSSCPRFKTDERAQKRKELFLNLQDSINVKECKKPKSQGTQKTGKEARNCWNRNSSPNFVALKELYEGRNMERIRSQIRVNCEGNSSGQPLNSTTNPTYSVKETCHALEALHLPDPEQVRAIPTPDSPVKNTFFGNAYKTVFMEEDNPMQKENQRQCTEAMERERQFKDPYSIRNCITTLNLMQGFTLEEIVKATKVFKDSANREVFLSLREDQRGFWLKAMFHEI